MAKGTLQIKRQIRSIGNTKKMTKAMELVSAAKMRKAIAAALATRPYALQAGSVLKYLSTQNRGEQLHPLLMVRPVKRVGIIVVSTNKGLCGGFNAALATLVRNKIDEEKKHGGQCDVLTIGKRARDILARFGASLTADFPKKDMTTSIADVLPLIHTAVKQYLDGTLDRVLLVYTDYVSSVRQKPVCETLLPFSFDEEDEKSATQSNTERMKELSQCLFEPTPEIVLDYVIPRLLETKIFQAVLESEASEHSARMLAMHNASQAATDILLDLRLTYNQIRQAGITQEIAEISSGRAALE
ncbi:MAG: ATP synthase F1 subunit gamma [Candidatus Uhrbacteria bacterium]|nr:ATP synthase F1 subunit gamma [Candidatus Uhrbacteria bacterium]